MTFRDRLGHRVPLILGHRGDADRYPENTIAAVRSALDAGADGVEVDFQRSIDGRLVVIHDDDLWRTTGAAGRVADRTAAELRALDAGSWRGAAFTGLPIPLLDEVFAVAARRGSVAVEIKESWDDHPDMAAAVLDEAAAASMADDVIVLAFDHRHLVAARESTAGATTGALVTDAPARPEALLQATGADLIVPEFSSVNASLCDAVHSAGAAVGAWTVDDDAEALRLAALGVDVLITNRPATMVAVLRAR